ncbi:MATE family efflux transporter [Halosquirtibacter laminarini]|uniref:MATE family efflux transporter n=1 Tax=Halosquirtibacter laminarini TaxID=3374600 RepID=A0AC61NP68_9BACT|nr:MATE family efflux transporter [Prolixibacteraceae bacterium]
MNKNKNMELESTPIKKLFWKYFIPSFTSVAVNSLYNIVDRIFIGHGVGAYALSGLSAVFPIMIIMMAFGMLVGMGAGVRISINMGKGDMSRAAKVLGNALTLLILLALGVTVLGFAVKGPVLKLFGASNQTIGYANDYLNIILFGTIFNMVGFGMNNLIRSEGNAKIAMYSIIISAGTNLILDPIFIFCFDMGVKGAAIATIISMAILCIWVLYHFVKSPKANIHVKREDMKLQGDIVWYIFTIGFAPFSMQIAASLVQGILNTQLIKYGGDLAVGAMGIINSVINLIIMSMIAINMASQPIIGYNIGAKKYKNVKEVLFLGIRFATVVGVICWIIVELYPQGIVKLFNHDSPELMKLSTRGLRVLLITLPVVGFQVVVSNYFQSIGKALTATIMSLLRQVILLIPLLLVIPQHYGLEGVWICGPISDTMSFIFVLFLFFFEMKKLNKNIEQNI